MRALLVCALAACSFRQGSLGDDISQDDAQPLDAVDAADAPPPTPWGTPVLVGIPPPTNTDDDPTLTTDRLELYMNSSRGGNSDIYVAARTNIAMPWGTPMYVMELSSTAVETTPEVSYDGLRMILASNRTGAQMLSQDLWEATRGNRTQPWGTPLRIVELCSDDAEAAGNVTPDGLFIILSSYRLGNVSPDLFYATRAIATDSWSTPIEITAVNTSGHEGSPFVTADKLTIYFDTNRDGDLDVYTSHRESIVDPFPAATKVVEISTTGLNEEDPWVSADQRRLVFTSNAGGTLQLWETTR